MEMEHLKFLVKVNNVVGYLLIASVILSPIGFIQVLVGHIVLLIIQGREEREGF